MPAKEHRENTCCHPHNPLLGRGKILSRKRRAFWASVIILSVVFITRPYVSSFNYIRAEQWFMTVETGKAIKHLEKAVRLDPHYLQAWLLLAWSYYKAGDLTDVDKAIEAYREAIKMNPRADQLYLDFGLLYYITLKDYPKAIYYFERAVALNPKNTNALRILTHAYEKDGQVDKALLCWKGLMKESPDDPATKNNVSRLQDKIRKARLNNTGFVR